MSKPKPGIEIVFLFCNVEALKTHRKHQVEWPCDPGPLGLKILGDHWAK